MIDQETVIRRAKKWKMEWEECVAWAEKEKNSQILKILNSHKSTFELLPQLLEQQLFHRQGEFWSNESAASEVDTIVKRVTAKILKLEVPEVSASKKEGHEHLSCSRH